MNTISHIHPDTSLGVLDMLSQTSDLDLANARTYSDPQVDGVWLVKLQDEREVIAYLAGHNTPWGDPREFNDFEVFYPEDE